MCVLPQTEGTIPQSQRSEPLSETYLLSGGGKGAHGTPADMEHLHVPWKVFSVRRLTQAREALRMASLGGVKVDDAM